MGTQQARLLRMPAVQERTGFSRTEIYKRIKAKTFPSPVKLGPRSVAWLEADIEVWIKALAQEPRP